MDRVIINQLELNLKRFQIRFPSRLDGILTIFEYDRLIDQLNTHYSISMYRDYEDKIRGELSRFNSYHAAKGLFWNLNVRPYTDYEGRNSCIRYEYSIYIDIYKQTPQYTNINNATNNSPDYIKIPPKLASFFEQQRKLANNDDDDDETTTDTKYTNSYVNPIIPLKRSYD